LFHFKGPELCGFACFYCWWWFRCSWPNWQSTTKRNTIVEVPTNLVCPRNITEVVATRVRATKVDHVQVKEAAKNGEDIENTMADMAVTIRSMDITVVIMRNIIRNAKSIIFMDTTVTTVTMVIMTSNTAVAEVAKVGKVTKAEAVKVAAEATKAAAEATKAAAEAENGAVITENITNMVVMVNMVITASMVIMVANLNTIRDVQDGELGNNRNVCGRPWIIPPSLNLADPNRKIPEYLNS
jgi:cytoskeletal protein RodZ